jgi:hypothetical protein
MFKRLLIIFTILSLVPLAVFAQSTGKIVGQIVDQATGEPLPGVNVTIDNTLLGANTDFDGYYVILNVPVGVYTVRASFIGFQEVAVENVRVSANLTTDVNFELKETPLELEEVITITAERPLVEKNITQSYSLVTSETIESIPVRGVTNILSLQPSVVVQDGNVYIRGGRTEEVGYYLDGANIVNPLNNTRAVHIIQDAVEEIQVLAGGYTAEFGGANSGIIKTELKTGTPQYHVSLDAQTDNFVGRGEKFLGTYSYGQSIVTGTFSGPVGDKNIRLFAAVENEFMDDWRKRFTKGFDFENLVDVNPNNPDANPALGGVPDTVSLHYKDGFTPWNDQNRWAVNGTLLFDFKPFQLRLSGVYSYTKTRNYDNFILNMLNDRYEWQNNYTSLLSAKFTHVLNPTTFYDVKVSYYDRRVEDEDSWFGTDWQSWSDSAAVSDFTAQKYGEEGRVTYISHHSEPYVYRLLGIPFNRNGDDSSIGNYNKTVQNYLGGSVNFVTQFNKFNEVKAGADVRYYTVRALSIDPDIMGLLQPYGTYASLDEIPEASLAELSGNTYGYDFLGNELNSGFNGARHPLFASFYVQDKLEFKDLIVNAGLRFDYFDTDDYTLPNRANIVVDANTGLIPQSEWIQKDPVMQISPRLGISFPITERTVFYAQYGKFIQMPELNDVYYNGNQFARQMIRGGYYYITPTGYGADPMRTTQYEMGFRQQIGEVASIDISGFYKNIIGQPQVQKVQAESGAQSTTYWTIANGDFNTTKGLEFKLILRRIERLQAQINYTLTAAEGTGANETAYYSASYNGTQVPTITSPLDYNQTHRGSILLDYRFGPDDGGPVLERLGANMIFSFNSGHPFTYTFAEAGGQADPYTAGTDYMIDTRSRQALEPLNSSVTPWNFNVDLRVDKSFEVYDRLLATVYVRVTNLFNSKNVINVFPTTGSATDDGYISNPTLYEANLGAYGPKYLELYKAINLADGQSYLDQVGRELFGTPRQIWLGLKLSY